MVSLVLLLVSLMFLSRFVMLVCFFVCSRLFSLMVMVMLRCVFCIAMHKEIFLALNLHHRLFRNRQRAVLSDDDFCADGHVSHHVRAVFCINELRLHGHRLHRFVERRRDAHHLRLHVVRGMVRQQDIHFLSHRHSVHVFLIDIQVGIECAVVLHAHDDGLRFGVCACIDSDFADAAIDRTRHGHLPHEVSRLHRCRTDVQLLQLQLQRLPLRLGILCVCRDLLQIPPYGCPLLRHSLLPLQLLLRQCGIADGIGIFALEVEDFSVFDINERLSGPYLLSGRHQYTAYHTSDEASHVGAVLRIELENAVDAHRTSHFALLKMRSLQVDGLHLFVAHRDGEFLFLPSLSFFCRLLLRSSILAGCQ